MEFNEGNPFLLNLLTPPPPPARESKSSVLEKAVVNRDSLLGMILEGESICLYGRPTSGKGLIASYLQGLTGQPVISCSEVILEAFGDDLQIVQTMQNGGLICDDLVISAVADRLSREDCDNGFILDGFPRSPVQAQWIKEFRNGMGCPLLLHLDVEESSCRFRMLDRAFKDKRSDDNPRSLCHRLAAHQKHEPEILDFFRKNNALIDINGEPSREEVLAETKQSLLLYYAGPGIESGTILGTNFRREAKS